MSESIYRTLDKNHNAILVSINIFTITLIFSLCVFFYKYHAVNKSECVLLNIDNARTDVAVRAVVMSCDSLFKN